MNLKEVKKISISKLEHPINKIIDIPSSKSLSIRALLLASIGTGKSLIKNVLDSDDTNNCLNALKSLGIKIEENSDGDFEITGCNGIFPIHKENTEVFVGSSGITSRFLIALLVASISKIDKKNISVILDGTLQLRKRPVKPLVDVLRKVGANITYKEEDGFLPIIIKPAKITADFIEVSGASSSQYVSSILMMSPLLEKSVKVKPLDIDGENHPYIKMAIQTMKDFGIQCEENNGIYKINSQNYKAIEFTIETDCNTANYFFALATATGSRIEINNINKNTLQPGILFLDILEKLGSKIEYKKDSIIVEGTGKLKGGFEIDMFLMAEMFITLGCLAVFADKPIKMYNVSHIRTHETDRIHAIYTELERVGMKCQEFDDGIIIEPHESKNVEVNTYEDHRMAMSLAIIGIAGNGIVIKEPVCVLKTCPTFFDLLQSIGVTLSYK